MSFNALNVFREFGNRNKKVESMDEKKLLETYPELKECPNLEESQKIVQGLMALGVDVQVKRDGGVMDDGWKIISIDGERTLTRKDDLTGEGKRSEWRYRTRELAKWNKDRIRN